MVRDQRTAPRIAYRQATDADIEAEHAVFVAAEGDLLERHGFGWPEPPPLERMAPGLRHLLAHDGGRCFVAEQDGRVVGYSAVFVRQDTAFLAALFIDPSHQGMGVGRELFALAFDGAPPRRLTISDAIQPISNAIYARNGLLPITPILGFRGEVTGVRASGLEAATPESDALAALDLAAYGFDRAVDHVYWATRARPMLWLREGSPVAYSYRWPTGRIGPIAGRDETTAAAALLAELEQPGAVSVEIPGTSRSLVRVALGAGLQLLAPAGLLLVSDGVEPPRSIAISSYGLM